MRIRSPQELERLQREYVEYIKELRRLKNEKYGYEQLRFDFYDDYKPEDPNP
jgi:hypothetical protein